MIFTKFINLLGFLTVSIYLGCTSTIHIESRPDILFIYDPRPTFDYAQDGGHGYLNY